MIHSAIKPACQSQSFSQIRFFCQGFESVQSSPLWPSTLCPALEVQVTIFPSSFRCPSGFPSLSFAVFWLCLVFRKFGFHFHCYARRHPALPLHQAQQHCSTILPFGRASVKLKRTELQENRRSPCWHRVYLIQMQQIHKYSWWFLKTVRGSWHREPTESQREQTYSIWKEPNPKIVSYFTFTTFFTPFHFVSFLILSSLSHSENDVPPMEDGSSMV